MTEAIDIIHKTCGQVAFRYDHRPFVGEALTFKSATWLDGSKPRPYEVVICGSCGETIGTEDLSVDGGCA